MTNVLLDYINKKHYVDIEVIRFYPYNICLNSLQLLNSFTPNSASIFNTK